MSNINWKRLGEAVEFYERELGASYIDTPWWATRDIMMTTCPSTLEEHAYTLDLNGKMLVASGEQSFLYMHAKGYITPGKLYQTITPCFREEPHTRFSRKHFMKCELFMAGDEADLRLMLPKVERAASDFFSQQTELPIVRSEEQHHRALLGSFDLGACIVGDEMHELGSYGLRREEGLGTWMYGTGCAEPRVSSVIACAKKGPKTWAQLHPEQAADIETRYVSPYRDNATCACADPTCGHDHRRPIGYHISDIPRGIHGELSKVMEEVYEAIDAEEQGSRLMLLQELSDVVLAASAVAEKYGMGMDDLVKMANITSRAFQSGNRKPQ